MVAGDRPPKESFGLRRHDRPLAPPIRRALLLPDFALGVASRARSKNSFPAGDGDGRARHIARQRVGEHHVGCRKLGGPADIDM
jgi:hypothetical protein